MLDAYQALHDVADGEKDWSLKDVRTASLMLGYKPKGEATAKKVAKAALDKIGQVAPVVVRTYIRKMLMRYDRSPASVVKHELKVACWALRENYGGSCAVLAGRIRNALGYAGSGSDTDTSGSSSGTETDTDTDTDDDGKIEIAKPARPSDFKVSKKERYNSEVDSFVVIGNDALHTLEDKARARMKRISDKQPSAEQKEAALAKVHAPPVRSLCGNQIVTPRDSSSMRSLLSHPSHLQPEYLGIVEPGADYGNIERMVSPEQMRKMIMADAAKWTQHTLPGAFEGFFEPIPGRTKGYRVKPYCVLHIDHVIPACFGGYDHPRNYCLMSGALNSSFQTLVDEKMALLGRDKMSLVRRFMTAVAARVRPHVDEAIRFVVRNDKIVGYRV